MNNQKTKSLFRKLGGKEVEGFPAIDSPVYYTSTGTPYLKKPGVVMLAMPKVNLGTTKVFLKGFGDELNFDEYLNDPISLWPAEELTKFAGQLCYASFGVNRTYNSYASRYFQNIVSSGHGSVLEHANFTFLWYGVSRTLTHELVRHRAGMGYSQLSQRYVSGKVLRFVERPEYQGNLTLHDEFEKRIDLAALWYERTSQALLGLQKAGNQALSAETRTDLRKKVQQAARSVLPGETETQIVLTGNVRALRHISSMRASMHAEVEIREAAFRTWLCLALVAPLLLRDYRIDQLSDGTYGVKTKFPKV